MFSRSVSRGVTLVMASRRMASVMSAPAARFAVPTVNVTQKRFHQVEVFGPFDPPKQLTFKDVEERVLKAIRAWDRFPADKESQLKIEADFVKDLGFDSLDHVEIMMAVEDEFGFEIPLPESEKLKTPRDVFKYICEREDVFK